MHSIYEKLSLSLLGAIDVVYVSLMYVPTYVRTAQQYIARKPLLQWEVLFIQTLYVQKRHLYRVAAERDRKLNSKPPNERKCIR